MSVSIARYSFLTSAKRATHFASSFFLWANFRPQMLLEHMERSSNVVHMLAGDWNSRNGKDGGEGALNLVAVGHTLDLNSMCC